MEEAKHNCVALKKTINTLEAGTDVNEFPQEITAKFINGMGDTDRKLKFGEVVKFIFPQFQEAKQNLAKYTEEIKGMRPSDFKKKKAEITKQIGLKKARIGAFEKMLKDIKLNMQSPWVPPPVMENVDEEFVTPVVNEDIDDFEVVVEVKSTTYDKTGTYVKIVLGGKLNRT